MPIRYDLVEKPFEKDGGGLFPKEIPYGTISARQFAAYVASSTTFSAGEVAGLLQILDSTMLRLLGQGWHVQFGDIGYFSPLLKVAGSVADRDDVRSSSVCVASVNFRPSAKLKKNVALLEVKRVEKDRRQRKSSPRNDELYSGLVRQYLSEKPFITVSEYMKITGRLRTVACADLRRMAEQGLLVPSGRGSHKVYLLQSGGGV